MSQLTWRISQALDEARILVLGAQVFIGFEYLSFFEKGFARLSPSVQIAKVIGLALMLMSFALLAAPATYHQIVEGGRQSSRFLRYVSQIMRPALLPFAIAFGIDAYVVGLKIEPRAALVAAASVTAAALLMWWGIAAVMKRVRKQPPPDVGEEQEPPIHERIDDVLTEVRVVLPGAQALLGFQFNTVLMEPFEKLSRGVKLAHVSSLVLVIVATIFFMTPAAYHRIVERGAATLHFYRFTQRMLILAMIPLALGLCLDFGVVAMIVTRSLKISSISASLLLLFFFGLWFGYTTLVRARHRRSPSD